MQYRKEIDGLRAIAVIPVVLFHSGLNFFSGGYVGVDVFFVISGFLITSIITEEIKQKKFSVLNFYERRARRILPALFFVLLITSILSLIFMSSGLLKSYSMSLISVIGFFSNIYFRFNSGYFATRTEEVPLIHTWSLSVEEQFYLLLPFMLVGLWFLGRKSLTAVLIVIALCSLMWAQHLATLGIHKANFYLIYSRFWELLAGVIIALNFPKKELFNAPVRQGLEVLGFLMIAYALVFYTDKTPFPGFYTLVPVLGTGLILLFSTNSSLVGRILASGVLVQIGLISYSLYLWHQPLLAFLKMKSIGHPEDGLVFVAIMISVVMAYLSWKYIERPFRNKQKPFNRPKFYRLLLSMLLLFVVFGSTGYLNNGLPQRFTTTDYSDSITRSPIRQKCHTQGHHYLPPDKSCEYFGKDVKWAALGDSHVVEPAYALAKKLEKNGEGLLHLSFSACPAALTVDIIKPPGCKPWFDEAMQVLKQRTSIENVVLSFRYSYHLFGNHVKTYPETPNVNPINNFTPEYKNNMVGSARHNYWLSLKDTILELKRLKKNVFVIYPIPELPIHIEKVVSPFSIFNHETLVNLEHSTTTDYYFKRHQYILEKLDALPYDDKLHAIKPFDVLCHDGFCSSVMDGKALYIDNNHLSIHGAQKVINTIGDLL